MKQAHYDPNNKGHFGLGFKQYCHFTSPIRRYPDLIVHRIIKGILRSNAPTYSFNELHSLARHSSSLERKADEAEKEYRKLKCMRYLSQHKHDLFDCVLVGIGPHGLHVRHHKTGIEGSVHCSQYEDQLHFDENAWILRDHNGKPIHQIGQALTLKLVSLNYKRMFIDFTFA